MRRHEENRRNESIRSRQMAQRLGIEEAHMLEFQTFNSMWDRTMKEYEERALELLDALRQRHELDARELRTKNTSAPSSMKQSSKLLDLRRVEQTLAKQVERSPAHVLLRLIALPLSTSHVPRGRQGEYSEAQKVKLRADSQEAAERERALAEREQQLAKAEAFFFYRQDQELNALRQRIQTGAEEQRVARQQDLERLLRRYQNIKAELESQQKAEALRHRRGLSTLPGATPRAFSSASSSRRDVARPSSSSGRLLWQHT